MAKQTENGNFTTDTATQGPLMHRHRGASLKERKREREKEREAAAEIRYSGASQRTENRSNTGVFDFVLLISQT